MIYHTTWVHLFLLLFATTDLINEVFLIIQVSILLIPNYEPPIAACAVREILSAISSGNVSDQPVIILPFIMKALKFNREMTNLSSSRQEVTLHAAEIGATTEFTRALVAGIANVSSSLQLNSEPLACLLHMVRVLVVPTVLLIASDGQNQKERSTDYEIEVFRIFFYKIHKMHMTYGCCRLLLHFTCCFQSKVFSFILLSRNITKKPNS